MADVPPAQIHEDTKKLVVAAFVSMVAGGGGNPAGAFAAEEQKLRVASIEQATGS